MTFFIFFQQVRSKTNAARGLFQSSQKTKKKVVDISERVKMLIRLYYWVFLDEFLKRRADVGRDPKAFLHGFIGFKEEGIENK